MQPPGPTTVSRERLIDTMMGSENDHRLRTALHPTRNIKSVSSASVNFGLQASTRNDLCGPMPDTKRMTHRLDHQLKREGPSGACQDKLCERHKPRRQAADDVLKEEAKSHDVTTWITVSKGRKVNMSAVNPETTESTSAQDKHFSAP